MADTSAVNQRACLGVGFGAVAPNIPTGQIAHESNQLALPFQVKIGSAPAQLSYFGLAPNYVGLYQFNVVVPDVPDNDLVPLTFTLNGTAGTQTLYLACTTDRGGTSLCARRTTGEIGS